MKYSIILFGLLIIVSSYSKPFEKNIKGKWKSENAESIGNGTFGIREFKFSKNKWEVKFTLYLDKELNNPVFTFRGTGNYILQEPSAKVTGAVNAVFMFSHKYLTLKTSNADLVKNFGLTGLERYKEKEVTENGLSFIESKTACGQEYDIVYMHDGKLYLGARPKQGENICSVEKRPVSLGLPLSKQ